MRGHGQKINHRSLKREAHALSFLVLAVIFIEEWNPDAKREVRWSKQSFSEFLFQYIVLQCR